MKIRPATDADHDAIWNILHEVVAVGDTYALDPNISREDALAEHCLNEERRLGFRAIQFNYVISTNTADIRLWQDLGFEIVGTLASAFRRPNKGYVDVYVMYRSLREK
jgi:L-amino acid N-acyltransferase YncA